jgi:hypothetical protein
MVHREKSATTLFAQRHLGSHVRARDHAAHPLLSGQSCPHPPTASQSADKVVKTLPGSNDFVAYVDAIGQLDGTRCLLEWKTTSSRYPEEPAGLLALDPQLVCYSWMTGIAEVAQIVFVRKRLVEVQYLQTTISEEQRREFGQLVEDTVGRIQSAQFLPHSGVRFPQNPCSSCPYVGFCLGRQDLAASSLVRRPGAEELGWLDELAY